MLDWMNHKLESRLPGEIPRTSDMQMIPLAGVQPQLIQGIRSGDGDGEDQDTIASIRY